jgi:S1-C subfamily serine protease
LNGFDLAILLAAGLAAFGGFRLGFLKRSIGWLGAALGLAIAFAVLPPILEQFEGEERPQLVLVSAAVLIVGALIGQAAGLLVASSFRIVLPPPLRVADRIIGALLGALIILLAVWLLLPIMKAVPTWPSDQVDDSMIAAALDDALPQAPDALDGLREVIEELAVPAVFSDAGDVPDVAPPPEASSLSPEVQAGVSQSVVRVFGVACGFLQQGSGVILAPGLVATSAHVVAGHETTSLEIDALGEVGAQLVYFDSEKDLALLRFTGSGVAALALAEPEIGEEGVVAGFPGGGPLTYSPFGLAERANARGEDIYANGEVTRDVLVLATYLEPGDSGAAVVNSEGSVIGLAFAVNPDVEGIGYALSEAELRVALGVEQMATSSGPCLARG